MIKLINGQNINNQKTSFTQSGEADSATKNLKYDKETVLPNNFATRFNIGYEKFSNAFTVYPARGLKGSKKADFYEFLTMGTVPYVIGSLTLMGVFNSANKHFNSFAKTKASKYGGKMALGVLFYGLAKSLAKPLITQPVKWSTGIDTELPYAKVYYKLPEYKDDTDITSNEYHKVFESVEFPRWDLLYKDGSTGEPRNTYYDKIAKKMGLGENLKDSDQEVKPRIKEIVTRTQTVKNIVPYLWAAVGVGIAFQKPWENLFPITKIRSYNRAEHFAKIKALPKMFVDSVKEFYTGGKNAKGIQKHSGKALFWIAALSTVFGIIRILNSSIKPSKVDSSDVIKKDRKYIVN